MKTLGEKRDEIAKELAVNDSWARPDESTYDRERRLISEGWNAAVQELSKVIEIYQDALDSIVIKPTQNGDNRIPDAQEYNPSKIAIQALSKGKELKGE